MPEHFICLCFYDEVASPTLHGLPERRDPCFGSLPTRCPSCVRLPVEDDDDEGPTRQPEGGPPLVDFSLPQPSVQLPSGTVHVPTLSPLSSSPEHLPESITAPPNITTSESESPFLRCPAAEEVVTALNIPSQPSSLDQGKELVLFIQTNAQKPGQHTRPTTNRGKSHSCVKKTTKGKTRKRARDTSGTGEDSGRCQTKRKKGKGAGNGGGTDKASRDSDGTRRLERRVLEDITNKILHTIT